MLQAAIARLPQVFPPQVLVRAHEYQQKGNVLNIRLSDGLLKARVKGSSNRIYDVHIDLKSWPQQPARCTCPYQNNCKHAAASLLSLQHNESEPSQNKNSNSLTEWLNSLQRQQDAIQQSNQSHEVAYLLHMVHLPELHLVLQLALSKRLKRGGFGKKIVFNSVNASRRQYFSREDEDIIAAILFKANAGQWFDTFKLRNSELLEKILQTGRAYIMDDGAEISLPFQPSKKADLRWVLDRHGQQVLSLYVDEQPVSPILLDKVWYYDDLNPSLGALDCGFLPSQLKTILSAPPVAFDEVATTRTTLQKTFPQVPVPRQYEIEQIKEGVPVPILSFDAYPSYSKNFEEQFVFVMDISFEYEGIRIDEHEQNSRLFQEIDEQLIAIKRDSQGEKDYIDQINQLIANRPATIRDNYAVEENIAQRRVLIDYVKEADLPVFYQQVIPSLKKTGWIIEFNHDIFEEIIHEEDIEWYANLEEGATDFFSYQLGILIDGKSVNIVPLVVELISRLNRQDIDEIDDNTLVKLPLQDGKTLLLKVARIKPLIRFILEYGSRFVSSDGKLEISRYQLILMKETEAALTATSLRWQGGEALRNQLHQLLNQDSLKLVEIPKGLQTQLRDYQHQGLSWLQFLRTTRFGGVLADDMGLGKTIQTLAHLQLEKEEGRLQKASLIVAPTSLIGNWQAEINRFTPQLKVLIFHGFDRHDDDFDQYDLIISTYGLIQRDKERFTAYPFYYLILDEAQFIKNARAKTTLIIQQIQARHRLCLSGTPLENNLGELWSLFQFLMPGLLGDRKTFRRFFQTPIEREGNQERRHLLAGRVKPFLLRRTKNEVANELPAKTEIIRTVELQGNQRDLYEAIRLTMEHKVREAIARQGLAKSHIILLDALLKLRQTCCDPRLLNMPEASIAHKESAKLEALMDLLDNLMAEGRRVLVFSQFTSMLQLIEQSLQQKNYAYLKLTGQSVKRQELVDTFQQGDTPIFLISLKAGGTGLNLTRADTVIHYDPWWNPAVEDQATDRSHRIGQENPVFVYKLIAAGTVEEIILGMQDKKRQLVDGILNNQSSMSSKLDAADIEQFFIPLPS